MPKPADSGARLRKFALLSTVGLMFPIAITMGAVAGYYADGWLDTFPWLSFVGLCMGVAAAFIHLMRVLKKFDEDS